MSFKSIYISFSKKVLLIILLITPFLFPQKTDVITLKNGDKITGELKALQTGLLELSTDNMSTIYIEWDKIAEISTDKFFEVELTDGRIYYGSFQLSDKQGMIIVQGVTLQNELFMQYIIRITRIRQTFWEILQGYIKIALSYNKGSNIGEINFGSDFIYTTKTQRSELIINSVLSSSEGNSTSKNNNASFSYSRFLEDKWFWGAVVMAQQNTELGLDLRTSIGGAVGNDFIQTNKTFLNALIGVTTSREWYIDATTFNYNVTGYLSSKYQYFIYDSPKVSVYSFLDIYPYLNNLGRIRLDYTLDFDWEVIDDFYWDLSFYFEYDNKPQSEDAETVDYSIETGFKYSL